ncbi:MAG: nucleoside hydrolase [Cyclobacteriaceae bacterium]
MVVGLSLACSDKPADKRPVASATPTDSKIPILFDTDANNELDDQHAMAYLFFNDQHFDIVGVTVNATYNGGAIDEQVAEAERVMKLCDVLEEIPLLKGSDADFEDIVAEIDADTFDGAEAVSFIIEEANKPRKQKLVLMPVGKLTNVALALKKSPEIADRVRIVWLGSNYPEPGEYNLENDIPAMNYILNTVVPFEMVMVRYGKPSGSDAVRATPTDIYEKLKGKGPSIEMVVEGRHGGEFNIFGDYSVSLFEHADLHGDPPSRALFDMVAVAILKNETWGSKKTIAAPIMVDAKWVERPENNRKIDIWEDFRSSEILEDFYVTIAKAN